MVLHDGIAAVLKNLIAKCRMRISGVAVFLIALSASVAVIAQTLVLDPSDPDYAQCRGSSGSSGPCSSGPGGGLSSGPGGRLSSGPGGDYPVGLAEV
jgi:hypothetical protein